MKRVPKIKEDPYKGKPWKDMDEYWELGRKHQLWGEALERFLKKENRKVNLIPNLKPPKLLY